MREIPIQLPNIGKGISSSRNPGANDGPFSDLLNMIPNGRGIETIPDALKDDFIGEFIEGQSYDFTKPFPQIFATDQRLIIADRNIVVIYQYTKDANRDYTIGASTVYYVNASGERWTFCHSECYFLLSNGASVITLTGNFESQSPPV